MNVKINNSDYEKELYEIIKLYFPDFQVANKSQDLDIVFENKGKSFQIKINEKTFEYKLNLFKEKNNQKTALYLALSEYCNKKFDWGTITGVRPTKLAYEMLQNGTPKYLLKENLIKEYHLSPNKAQLLKEVIENQNCIIKNDNIIDIFINIPICPSRCKYCSFISAEFVKVKDYIPNYIDCLIKEINCVKKIIKEKNYIVRSIYIGGGTPTILSCYELEMILSELNYPSIEFTVEAGRPETITKEKLDILKKYNVNRICINPQTFCDKTLKLINRNHTINDVIKAYSLALNYGFKINIDLIAGLPGENFSKFKKSLNTTIEMAPNNITIHTLALKRGSLFTNNLILNNQNLNSINIIEKDIKKMIDYAYDKLKSSDYFPYYLYKQKNTPLGLENVGYTQKNDACIFNINSIEDTSSVLACGAHAISKRIFTFENRIERIANVKFINEYINRIDEMIERKIELFK